MRFEPTQWGVVYSVRSDDAAVAAAALEKLCSTYWPALYGYIRRRGYSPEDAKDLTQEFLSRLVQRNWLGHLKERRAKFRSFLLTFLEHFLSDERDRASALKRGGGRIIVPLDAMDGDERCAAEPADRLTPDQVYTRQWAQSLLSEAARRLQFEYESRGKGALYQYLKDLEPGKHGSHSYRKIGAIFDMSEQAVKNAVFSLRRRFCDLLRREVERTVPDPSQVDEELRELVTAAF